MLAERGGAPLTCAINLSGTSINAEGFLDVVRQQAARHALPPRAICLEITETVAINNMRNAAEFIRECKAQGFCLRSTTLAPAPACSVTSKTCPWTI